MNKLKQVSKIKELFAKGENIIQYLKSSSSSDKNSIEDILISYDFQSGAYVKDLAKNSQFKIDYCDLLAKEINQLGEFNSIIEIGVGEATTIGVLLKKLIAQPNDKLGLDISWSRLKFAQDFLREIDQSDVQLLVANLFEIPFADNSIEVVYTSHSIEPNGGREKEALEELYRISSKYVVLLEPAFELANDEARKRMQHHGYITNLHQTALDLGYNVIEHRLFGLSANPLNPTGLLIIEKNTATSNTAELKCPLTGTELKKHSDSLLFSEESLLSYPIIEGIPCLLKENAILTAHLKTDFQEFKKTNQLEFDKI
ncbi:MAG: methyltransferase domain-containing protein [Crocinitomicaceae bacterium]